MELDLRQIIIRTFYTYKDLPFLEIFFSFGIRSLLQNFVLHPFFSREHVLSPKASQFFTYVYDSYYFLIAITTLVTSFLIFVYFSSI